MIGVYLGFALNNFGEERKERKQFKDYQVMLKTELQDNLTQIDSVQQYHIDLRNDLQKIFRSDQMVEDFQQYTFRGLQPGIVGNSAYETGIQSGLNHHFSLEIMQNVNRVYTLQQVYSNFNDNLIQSITSKKFPETEEEIRSMLRTTIMYMNDIQSFESQLIERYAELLKTFE